MPRVIFFCSMGTWDALGSRAQGCWWTPADPLGPSSSSGCRGTRAVWWLCRGERPRPTGDRAARDVCLSVGMDGQLVGRDVTRANPPWAARLVLGLATPVLKTHKSEGKAELWSRVLGSGRSPWFWVWWWERLCTHNVWPQEQLCLFRGQRGCCKPFGVTPLAWAASPGGSPARHPTAKQPHKPQKWVLGPLLEHSAG